jgi:glutamate racemase
MIGIFDSGIGGLTLVRKLLKVDSTLDFMYLGDTARTPYGTRSKETVTKFADECTRFLLSRGANIIVVACNTATAQSLPELQKAHPDIPIIGVIVPGVEKALGVTKNKRIGVVGTYGTIASGAYERELKKRNDVEVFSIPCPLLVPITEEGWGDHAITRKVIKTYVRSFKDIHVDTVILGCTHYPVVKRVFQEILGKKIYVVNPSKEAALKLLEYLQEHPEIQVTHTGHHEYFVTDQTERFKTIGQRFLGTEMLNLDLVTL